MKQHESRVLWLSVGFVAGTFVGFFLWFILVKS